MDGVKGLFSNAILDEFSSHSSRMREAARSRREAVQLRACVDDHADAVATDIKDTLGVRQPNDKYAGCVNLRTLRSLLTMVDGATAAASGICVKTLMTQPLFHALRRPWFREEPTPDEIS